MVNLGDSFQHIGHVGRQVCKNFMAAGHRTTKVIGLGRPEMIGIEGCDRAGFDLPAVKPSALYRKKNGSDSDFGSQFDLLAGSWPGGIVVLLVVTAGAEGAHRNIGYEAADQVKQVASGFPNSMSHRGVRLST